jgi:hypothetical protein
VANEIVAACGGATLPRKLERVVGKSVVFEAETSTEEKVVQVARWLDLEETAEVQEMEHENALMQLLTLRVSNYMWIARPLTATVVMNPMLPAVKRFVMILRNFMPMKRS